MEEWNTFAEVINKWGEVSTRLVTSRTGKERGEWSQIPQVSKENWVFFSLFFKIREVEFWNGSYIDYRTGNIINLLPNPDVSRVFENRQSLLERLHQGCSILRRQSHFQLRQEAMFWEDWRCMGVIGKSWKTFLSSNCLCVSFLVLVLSFMVLCLLPL